MNRRRFLAAIGAVTATQKWQRSELDPVDIEIAPSRFPYVQSVQSERATIMWTTLEAGSGGVEYTSDGLTIRSAGARARLFTRAETGLPAAYTQYQAELTGLTPGTSYSYKVFVDGSPVLAAADQRFQTAGPGPFNFLVLGDSGVGDTGFGDRDKQFQIARQMLIERPAFVIHTGDVVYPNGSYDYYGRNYFNYYYASMGSTPFFPCPGNHDYMVQNAAPYLAVHAFPGENVPAADRGRYYSYDWGNVHFVSVDSNLGLERAVNSGGPMLKWLDDDLRSTRQFWRVVYFHHPPYATGPNQNDISSLWARQHIVPILEAHGVQVVFSGHEHSYQRSQCIRRSRVVAPNTSIHYFVTGGGGAILYPVANSPMLATANSVHHYMRAEVNGTRMVVRAKRFDGTEMENVTLSPQPVFSDDPDLKPISFQPAPTAGSLIRVIGRSLASEETYLCTVVPPTELAGTTVTVNGQPISLLYVSNNQIYGQLPFTVEGNITVKVTTANGSVELSA